MNHPFKVGDKVVCVDDKFESGSNHLDKYINLPEKNEVYVVREIRFGNITHKPSITLIGIYNPYHPPTNLEYGFHTWHFRKLEEVQEENRLKKDKEIYA